jgi:IS1 family transposase
VEKYYTDGHFGYENVYGKKASRKKSRFTNIVENLNSQIWREKAKPSSNDINSKYNRLIYIVFNKGVQYGNKF